MGSLPWDVVSLWGRGIVDGAVYEALGAIIHRKFKKQTRCCSLGECMLQMRDGAASLSLALQYGNPFRQPRCLSNDRCSLGFWPADCLTISQVSEITIHSLSRNTPYV